MKVYIKKFLEDMEIKTKGVEIDVYKADDKTRLGDLTITKTKLIWCNGKERVNGVEITWEDFIEIMNARRLK